MRLIWPYVIRKIALLIRSDQRLHNKRSGGGRGGKETSKKGPSQYESDVPKAVDRDENCRSFVTGELKGFNKAEKLDWKMNTGSGM